MSLPLRRSALLAAAALVLGLTASPAMASAATDTSDLLIDDASSVLVSYHNTATWAWTVTNDGTGPTASPLVLRFVYNDGTNPYVTGTPGAWSNPTVSSPETKQCTVSTATKTATCTAPALRPGQSVHMTVTARADLAGKTDSTINWRFSATRGKNDPDVPHNTRLSSTSQRALRGSFDSAIADPHGVRVRGWIDDAMHTGGTYVVTATVDGVRLGREPNGVPRPDVQRAGFQRSSGYDFVVPTTGAGSKRVCLVGGHVGYEGTLDLGCRSVVFAAGTPQGALDVVTGSAGQISVSGWAYDVDALDRSTTLLVTARDPWAANATTIATISTDQPCPDVNRVKKVSGNRGFSTTISTKTALGTQTVCVVALNVGAGSDRALGCREIYAAVP